MGRRKRRGNIQEEASIKLLEIDNKFLNFKQDPSLKTEDYNPMRFINEFNEILGHIPEDEIPQSENLYKLLNISENLLALLQINYKCNNKHIKKLLKDITKNIGLLEQIIDQNIETASVDEVVVNFCGTSCIPFINNSAHDEFVSRRLNENPNCVALNISGIAIDDHGKNHGLQVATGSGMNTRIEKAIIRLVKINKARKAEGQASLKLTILGHSRGAVKALALAEILDDIGYSDADILVVSHDPVPGGTKDLPSCLNASFKYTDINGAEQKRTVKEILSSEELKIPGKLLVVARENECRTKFKLLNIPTAFLSRNTTFVSMPGFHNIGVYKGSSATLDTYTAFKGWLSWAAFNISSWSSNQSGSVIDPNRNNFKAFEFDEYSRLIEDAYQKKQFQSHSTSVCRDNALSGNPVYHAFRAIVRRSVPLFMRSNENADTSKCDYPLDKLIKKLSGTNNEALFKSIVDLARPNHTNTAAFSEKVYELNLDQLFDLFTLIEGSLESPKLSCEENNDSELMSAVRLISKENNPLRINSHGQTKEWQGSLKIIAQAMSDKVTKDTAPEQIEHVKYILSEHRERIYSIHRLFKTPLLNRFEPAKDVAAERDLPARMLNW